MHEDWQRKREEGRKDEMKIGLRHAIIPLCHTTDYSKSVFRKCPTGAGRMLNQNVTENKGRDFGALSGFGLLKRCSKKGKNPIASHTTLLGVGNISSVKGTKKLLSKSVSGLFFSLGKAEAAYLTQLSYQAVLKA